MAARRRRARVAVAMASTVWVGCADPYAQTLDAWGSVDGEDLLDPPEAFSESVRPLALPAAKLTPEGPLVTSRSTTRYWGSKPFTVVDDTPWPRITVDAGDVRLLLYVDRSALTTWVVAEADGTGVDGDGTVRLRPGVEVDAFDIDADTGEAVVHVELSRVHVDARVPARIVDQVVGAEAEHAELRPADDAEGEPGWLRSGGVITGNPGGDTIATVTDDDGLAVTLIGGEERGWNEVVLDLRDVWIRGWVATDDLTEPGSASSRCACSGWISMIYDSVPWWPNARVPAGTLIRAGAADGPVVGLALEDIWVDNADVNGAMFRRDLELGRVELWVAPGDLDWLR